MRDGPGGGDAEMGAHANNVTRLVGSATRRLRVGDFRAIFEESDTEIIVTKIAPRGNARDENGLDWKNPPPSLTTQPWTP